MRKKKNNKMKVSGTNSKKTSSLYFIRYIEKEIALL
jgi:hypothetical protein